MYLILENGTPREITLRQLAKEFKDKGYSPPAWWSIASEEQRNAALSVSCVEGTTVLSETTGLPS